MASAKQGKSMGA
jgi:hypothetical protein